MNNGGKRPNSGVAQNLVVAFALAIFVAVSFYLFTQENNRRVLEQNASYLEASTAQTAERLNNLFENSQSNVELLAHLYSAVMSGPEVDAEMLQDMIERSPFDYVEFISPDGTDLTADGRTADLSDRDYFQDGMKGNSGRCVIYNSRITNETLLIFYAPFRYEDRVIGVLSGVLRGQTLDDLLARDYFGLQNSIYLLERNGNVIFSAGDAASPDNLIDYLQENDRITPDNLQKLEAALEADNGIDFSSFTYKGSQGDGNAYVTILADGEWALVQSFPSGVTRGMTESANSAGSRLQISLAIAFLGYILYIIVRNQLQKRQLVSEKQTMSDIVAQTTQLFARFALVDFEADSYEYLTERTGGAAPGGRYSDLVRFLDGRYVREVGESEPMSERIGRVYVQRHLTEDVPYLQFEYQIERDGRRWENISILCLERQDGVPTKVLYAVQDVTALKEKEAEIRLALNSASQAAEAASRAKSDFLARMSHDIRTPMNAIMGMTAVAAMHLDDQERLSDCLNKITISSRHLLALINDILDMSKIESGKVVLTEEPFGIADLVESVVTIIRPQANSKGQQLNVRIADIRHEAVVGDTLRLRQVFVNILGNAVKFTPEGGQIDFTIRELPSAIQSMACYSFVCTDNGIGMDEDFLATIFEPFSRSQNPDSRKVEGTGLGMSITRNIVRMMEGDIRVESQLGVGSTFTVEIHLKLQDQAAESVEELADLRVLVADDDESAGQTACETLESLGMQAQWVDNGDEAVARTLAAHTAGEGFAAVILDWKMPGKDGLQTAREIRAKVGDELPIIILSAYDWTDIEAEARSAGIQTFIEKPLFRSRLVSALKSALAQSGSRGKLEAAELETSVEYEGKRVLLVEDNELNREIAGELLTMIGIVVEQAADGQAAVDMVTRAAPGYYDLVFMDIQMPVLDGYEATRRIRAIGRPDTDALPIVAMTANAFADDIREAREAGMNDHMSKPVEVAKLMEVLGKWLKR